MLTAQLFANGKNQAVMLPQEYRFAGTDVYIQKSGDAVLLFPKDKDWDIFLDGVNSFSADFMSQGREQGVEQMRESL
jgi:antitoxin VapB